MGRRWRHEPVPPIDEDLLRNKDLMNDHQLLPEDVKQTLFQRLTDRLPEHSQVMLNQQYRMIRPIGDMISTCFYDEKLRSPNDGGLEGYALGFGKPVLWLDTSAHGEARREAAPHGKGKSFANRSRGPHRDQSPRRCSTAPSTRRSFGSPRTAST